MSIRYADGAKWANYGQRLKRQNASRRKGDLGLRRTRALGALAFWRLNFSSRTVEPPRFPRRDRLALKGVPVEKCSSIVRR